MGREGGEGPGVAFQCHLLLQQGRRHRRPDGPQQGFVYDQSLDGVAGGGVRELAKTLAKVLLEEGLATFASNTILTAFSAIALSSR